MNLELADRVILVTGGASGIGESIVNTLEDEGAIPVVLDLKPASESPFDSRQYKELDLNDESGLVKHLEAIHEDFARIDGVVNNAGLNDSVGLSGSLEAFESSLRRNLLHCFSLVKHTREALIETRGAIVNIGSKVAETGQGGTSGYAAAKGGLLALTREWALEFASSGVRCNAVIPAEVWTPMYEFFIQREDDPEGRKAEIESLIPLGQRMTTPAEIAAMVVFLLSPLSAHTTGQIIHVDGGYTHLDRAFRAE
jgi:L-fucose dehydrogenase